MKGTSKVKKQISKREMASPSPDYNVINTTFKKRQNKKLSSNSNLKSLMKFTDNYSKQTDTSSLSNR